jgi:IclR helix-turn-helix domain
LHRAERLVVDGDGARLLYHGRVLLHGEAPHAQPAQQVDERQTGRPAADNGHKACLGTGGLAGAGLGATGWAGSNNRVLGLEGSKGMAGPDRTISVLKLFTLDRPTWTVEEAAPALHVSVSSAYRYFAALTEAGLLTTASSSHYILGPAIIQYDRQIQLTDPLLRIAKPIVAEIIRFAPENSTVLLCRIFRDTVLCVHQVTVVNAATRVSYERGRPCSSIAALCR